jgi:hypothetical protein
MVLVLDYFFLVQFSWVSGLMPMLSNLVRVYLAMNLGLVTQATEWWYRICQSGSANSVILDNNYADADPTHIAYAVLASNTSTILFIATFGVSGPGQYLTFLDGDAVVTMEGIRMPASSVPTNYNGTIINYGVYNGNPPGGSYTKWIGNTAGGQYIWVDGGVAIASLDTQGFNVRMLAGFDGFGAYL